MGGRPTGWIVGVGVSGRPTVPPKPDSPPVPLNPNTGSLPPENLKMEKKNWLDFVKIPQSWFMWIFSLIIAPSSPLYQLYKIELVSPRLFLCSSNYIVLGRHDRFRRLTTVNWVIKLGLVSATFVRYNSGAPIFEAQGEKLCGMPD